MSAPDHRNSSDLSTKYVVIVRSHFWAHARLDMTLERAERDSDMSSLRHPIAGSCGILVDHRTSFTLRRRSALRALTGPAETLGFSLLSGRCSLQSAPGSLRKSNLNPLRICALAQAPTPASSLTRARTWSPPTARTGCEAPCSCRSLRVPSAQKGAPLRLLCARCLHAVTMAFPTLPYRLQADLASGRTQCRSLLATLQGLPCTPQPQALTLHKPYVEHRTSAQCSGLVLL